MEIGFDAGGSDTTVIAVRKGRCFTAIAEVPAGTRLASFNGCIIAATPEGAFLVTERGLEPIKADVTEAAQQLAS